MKRYQLRAHGRLVCELSQASPARVRRIAQQLADTERSSIEVHVAARPNRRHAARPKSARVVASAITKSRRRRRRRVRTQRHARKRGRRRNPAAAAPVLERAARTFRRWHGFDPSEAIEVRAERVMPRTVVKIGEVTAIAYKSDKWTGKVVEYEHKTSAPRPWLCTGPDGKGLFLLRGNVRVTGRGLVG